MGNLPGLPAGRESGIRLLAPDDFVSTGCPSHFGRQVADQNRLGTCLAIHTTRQVLRQTKCGGHGVCSLVVMNITTMTFVAPNLACGKARGGSISRSGSVTDEQRSHRPNSAQPFGRQFFFGQTSLLAPHRPLKGMLVARASPD